jgi:hypothetical protein
MKIHAALLEAVKELSNNGGIKKNSTVQYKNSKYQVRTIEDIIDKSNPILSKHNIVLTYDLLSTEVLNSSVSQYGNNEARENFFLFLKYKITLTHTEDESSISFVEGSGAVVNQTNSITAAQRIIVKNALMKIMFISNGDEEQELAEIMDRDSPDEEPKYKQKKPYPSNYRTAKPVQNIEDEQTALQEHRKRINERAQTIAKEIYALIGNEDLPIEEREMEWKTKFRPKVMNDKFPTHVRSQIFILLNEYNIKLMDDEINQEVNWNAITA